MCDLCDKIEALTGKKLTEQEAADIKEKEARMEEIAKTIYGDVGQFVTAMRDKYGNGTFPPLVQAMAAMIGHLLGQLTDDAVRQQALDIMFQHLNAGFNQVLPKEKQTMFAITSQIVDVDAIKAALEEARDTQVTPPILH